MGGSNKTYIDYVQNYYASQDAIVRTPADHPASGHPASAVTSSVVNQSMFPQDANHETASIQSAAEPSFDIVFKFEMLLQVLYHSNPWLVGEWEAIGADMGISASNARYHYEETMSTRFLDFVFSGVPNYIPAVGSSKAAGKRRMSSVNDREHPVKRTKDDEILSIPTQTEF